MTKPDLPFDDDPFGLPDDDEFDIDLRGAGLIPVGEYIFECTSVEHSESAAGNPMMVFQFAVADGMFAGRALPVYAVMTPQAMWKVAETLEALGVAPTDGRMRFRREEILGTHVVGVVEHQEYEGRTRPSIRTLKPHPRTTPGKPYAPSRVG